MYEAVSGDEGFIIEGTVKAASGEADFDILNALGK